MRLLLTWAPHAQVPVAPHERHDAQAGQPAALHVAVLQARHRGAGARHAGVRQRAVPQVQVRDIHQLGQLLARLVSHLAPA